MPYWPATLPTLAEIMSWLQRNRAYIEPNPYEHSPRGSDQDAESLAQSGNSPRRYESRAILRSELLDSGPEHIVERSAG
jgi:hypothetical protein